VDGALFGVFINQGEVCSAGSRVLVEKKIYTKFVEAMTEKAKRIKLGPAALDRDTKMGPLVSKEQYDRGHLVSRIGKKEAKTAIGGEGRRRSPRAYYVEPTIFYDVQNSARIAREEIFGPVASVIPFENEARPSASPTTHRMDGGGCMDARYLQSVSRGEVHSRRNRVGQSHATHLRGSAVGRIQAIGFGRELGPWGLEEYLETKQVFVNLDETPIGWY